jgi:NAD(P)H-hydrate epimerase
MIPVVTPDEMRAIDAAAPEPVDELIRRAGSVVSRAAIDMLGGTYGRVVNVVAGAGNNGADGRDAARRLAARGIRVEVFDASACPPELPTADLVIDAAYGTGYRPDPARPWIAPHVGDALVLAVDIPSGVDALTGIAPDGVLAADRTISFQALKPGLLFASGASLSGEIRVADIGLDTDHIACHLVEASDVARWWPVRAVDAHKWHAALKVIAGSPGMPGAAELCTAAAARGGSGLVSLSAPGCRPNTRSEIVQHAIPAGGFCSEALSDIGRFGALVIGPGLGREDHTLTAARQCIGEASVPVVVDGDALFAASWSGDGAGPLFRERELATVLTPHDGEFGFLTGERPGDDRIASARAAVTEFDSTVLLKGPTTIVASPGGRVLLVDRGDQRLATAGSGDVLAGLIGAALAAGAEPGLAAASAAWLHGEAARLGPEHGLLANDIVDLIPLAIGALR